MCIRDRPVTDELTAEEIGGDYVHNTGIAITRRFQGLDPHAIPAVLVAGHAPFCWGKTPLDAAHNAAVLETVARMAYYTSNLRQNCAGVSQALLDRHYFRKHGANAVSYTHLDVYKRQVYTADLTAEWILEFLLLNPQFPHSLRYSID